MLHELRIYRCNHGKLPALHKRFETVVLELWKKHGIRPVGFWTVDIGGSMSTELYYLLEWENLAEREQKWNAFQSDPEWIAKRAESEKDGPILRETLNLILKPTPYSKMR